MKTYQIRLFPSSEQEVQLNELSHIRNELWNYFIDIEQKEYSENKKIVHNYGLDKLIKEIRKNSHWGKLNTSACQRLTKEVYSAYQGFYKRYVKDKSSRPPKKIENIENFHTIVWNTSGWMIKDDIIRINWIPFKFKSYVDINEYHIKEIKIKLINNKWLCDLCVDDKPQYEEVLTQKNNILAIDLGLKHLGTGVDNNGNVIVLNNKSKKISKYYLKKIGDVQSKISKKIKGSKRWKYLKKTKNILENKKNKQVKQTLHIQSNKLLNMNYRTIVIGDLSIQKLMKNVRNKNTNVSKSFAMSNISMFVNFLTYKSFKYKTDIVKIDERYTTQINSLTGKLFENKIELSDRSVKLCDNVEIDRDLNSAINILERYFNNHLASMTKPPEKSGVIKRFNLLNEPLLNEKPIEI
jgi:putative transposase